MPVTLTWSEIALRLLCTLLAGSLTWAEPQVSVATPLALELQSSVSLAACLAMLQVNLLVAGVTTAASMWYVTVLGLCFGGGQIEIGWVGTAMGVVVLSSLKLVENQLKRDHQGKLVVVSSPSRPRRKRNSRNRPERRFRDRIVGLFYNGRFTESGMEFRDSLAGFGRRDENPSLCSTADHKSRRDPYFPACNKSFTDPGRGQIQ